MEKVKSFLPEIVNDDFYVKRLQDDQPCKFAYLHLSADADNIFIAFFENRNAEEPVVYWWKEDDIKKYEESKRTIVEFIGEAYLSLYIKYGLERPSKEPLWKYSQSINCAIPSNWRDIVKEIKRGTNGYRKEKATR